MKALILCLTSLSLAVPAFAQTDGGQPGMPPADMTKVGPASRKVKDEKAVKKQIDGFFKEDEELTKKGDFEGMLARIDFPIYMVTDDSKGVVMAKLYTREEYVAEMKPFWESMPKDMKVKHKPTVSVLSDSLVNVVDDYTMEMGKQKVAGRSQGLLVKRDGKWMWKTMVEAGWGDMAQAHRQHGASGAAPGGQPSGMQPGKGQGHGNSPKK